VKPRLIRFRLRGARCTRAAIDRSMSSTRRFDEKLAGNAAVPLALPRRGPDRAAWDAFERCRVCIETTPWVSLRGQHRSAKMVRNGSSGCIQSRPSPLKE
jgi:hypothetical protein